MIENFINFVTELFPSINPYTKEAVKDSIRQFEKSGEQKTYTMLSPFDHLAQGDILGEELPFFKQDKKGNLSVLKAKAILLSNTCDSSRDDILIFAPLMEISKLEMNENDLKNNQIYRFLYIPDPALSDYVIDFSLLNSFSRELIETSLENGRFTKIKSLNNLGYYLFLCKLTVHLMRPEDDEVQEERMLESV